MKIGWRQSSSDFVTDDLIPFLDDLRDHSISLCEEFAALRAYAAGIGGCYLNQAADHFHVVELSILPEYQGHGIGHQLMKSVQAEAFRLKLPVRLRVARGNPAIRFYQGLSFKITGAGATHDSLEWVPGNT